MAASRSACPVAGSRWVPEPGTLVCNLGDMLERMTGGRYRSTPHRVRNSSGRDRTRFPFFFDPGWDAEIHPVPGVAAAPDESGDVAAPRWDGGQPPHLAGDLRRVPPGVGREGVSGPQRPGGERWVKDRSGKPAR